MNTIIERTSQSGKLDKARIRSILERSIKEQGRELKKVLILPPDFTRSHSGGGQITAMYYDILKDTCQVDIMPALGTHMAVTREEQLEMFGESIPEDRFLIHHWKADVVKIGEVPAKYVKEISEGVMNQAVDVEVNKRLLDKSYDLIISIGQVVPHVIVGMANYSKNIFVGCGGKSMIDHSHMLGAFYGLERIMGRDHTPVRKLFDYAEVHHAKDIPLMYLLTVTTQEEEETTIHGLFIGRERKIYEEAVKLSQQRNITFTEKTLKKVVAYLDEKEFKSTWLGNKAIYRTRMAIEDGGELIILAPGVKQFGEDIDNDRIIRKYGYAGRENVLKMFKDNEALRENQSATAHLIHGSVDGRFEVTYAVQHLSKEEIEGVHYHYMDLKEAYEKYNPQKLKEGFNTLADGEEIYYISAPTLGLWADKNKF